jgi:very-short-patch-repair endonuclease
MSNGRARLLGDGASIPVSVTGPDRDRLRPCPRPTIAAGDGEPGRDGDRLSTGRDAAPAAARAPAAATTPVAASPGAAATPTATATSTATAARTAATTDDRIAALAAGQHGVVARWQLLELGVTATQIDHRRRRSRLHPVHPAIPGVYLVGHAVAPTFAVETAALLLCRGRPAALARRTAAAVHGFADPRPGVDLLQVGGTATRSPAIRASVVAELPRWQVVRRHGLWLTTPARTFLDLAASAPPGEVERCLDRARIGRLVTDDELDAVLEWARGRRGARSLAALLEAERDGGYSRSGAERQLLRLLRVAGLPAPERNVPVLGRERDLGWSWARTVVEFDGRRYHLTPARWEDDHDRDGELLAHGWRTFRVTWTMLRSRPYEVVARAAAVLALAERDLGAAAGVVAGVRATIPVSARAEEPPGDRQP